MTPRAVARNGVTHVSSATWYSCCDVEGLGSIGNAGVNGFRGFMILAWFLALAAVTSDYSRALYSCSTFFYMLCILQPNQNKSGSAHAREE